MTVSTVIISGDSKYAVLTITLLRSIMTETGLLNDPEEDLLTYSL